MLRDRLLGNVFTKTIRDWLTWTIIAIVALWGISALYIALMGSSGDLYATMVTDMPEALANIYGMNDCSAEGLAMSGIFFVMGPLVLLTYTIGLGSSAAVGEEEAGTLPILLASPLRRRSILLAKTAVAVLGAVFITAAMWVGVEVLGAVFGIEHVVVAGLAHLERADGGLEVLQQLREVLAHEGDARGGAGSVLERAVLRHVLAAEQVGQAHVALAGLDGGVGGMGAVQPAAQHGHALVAFLVVG